MNATSPRGAPTGNGGGGGASGSGRSSAQQSPISARAGGHKRNRSLAGFTDGSPASEGDEEEDEEGENKRKTGVKRACNDCRQQKLRCNVVQDPFQPCNRCTRLKLECKIESNFKRVGKRNKHAEMERELNELRQRLAIQSDQISTLGVHDHVGGIGAKGAIAMEDGSSHDQYMGNHEVVASLLDLRQGHDNSGTYSRGTNGSLIAYRTLGAVRLSPSRVLELFTHYWEYYHDWLPILDPTKSPDHYFSLSELLFWVIISVAARRFPADTTLLNAIGPSVSELIWARISHVPQSYHIVKAMCLLCTWPLPTSSTSTDSTLMVSGVMMSIAMHFGLHRPSHAQDFSKFRVELREENLLDRVKTWAACNIVAQTVSTGYGQPASTLYDWTLEPDPSKEESYQIPAELEARLRIEKFCDKITRTLYSNRNDPLGLLDESQRIPTMQLLNRELEELHGGLHADLSDLNLLQLRAAALHLRLSAFFDSPNSQDYRRDLLALYFATQHFLEMFFSLDSRVLAYASNYILQMTVAAGFTLLKLLNSFFSSFIDVQEGRQLFARTIQAIRTISVKTNDLPSRLAEVLSQMWRGTSIGNANIRVDHTGSASMSSDIDGSLQLKVRCRMSMSLVFDSVWRWREEFQSQGRVNLDSAVKNPTNPDSVVESSASSMMDPSLPVQHTSAGLVPLMPNVMSINSGFPNPPAFEPNYEVWDPLSWTLDGLVEFPYSLNGIDGNVGSVV